MQIGEKLSRIFFLLIIAFYLYFQCYQINEINCASNLIRKNVKLNIFYYVKLNNVSWNKSVFSKAADVYVNESLINLSKSTYVGKIDRKPLALFEKTEAYTGRTWKFFIFVHILTQFVLNYYNLFLISVLLN